VNTPAPSHLVMERCAIAALGIFISARLSLSSATR
jgi:hypothetical protein